MRFKPGMTIGGWKLSKRIGRGGNGVVFRATKNDRVAAVKILHATKELRRITRFSDEIAAMKRCNALTGVLPIYDSFLSATNEGDPPWLAMALAIPLTDALGRDPKFDNVIRAVRDIAGSLSAIHDLGIAHRDIKPDNLFSFEGKWVIGDFGLANFDSKRTTTAQKEKVGPIYYIAPEMLNSARVSDGKPADVYSLSKTLWVLSTGQTYPIPGQQLASIPSMTISAFVSHPRAALLDSFLEAATAFEPSARPTMPEFYEELDAWLNPPSSLPAGTIDISEFKRLLEGRVAIVETHATAVARANKRREAQGVRVRELFRPIANELLDHLKAASFLSASLQLDNLSYGFEVQATVPYEPDKRDFHRIRITLHTNPQGANGDRFHLYAWYRHEHITSNGTQQNLLWNAERDFISGGSEELREVEGMKLDLLQQFRPAVINVQKAAGILDDGTENSVRVNNFAS